METENKGFDYFAFISYSHKDQELARRLKKRLQSYHLPSRLRKLYPSLPKKLRPVFLDESSLVSIDESLQKSLYKNLDNSNYLIVICSPNSAKSEYVNDEVKHFIEIGRRGHIVPLIIDGVPHSGDEATECFPQAIRDLPRELEPLGIDLTKFGERDAFLRVIATMLGLNIDKFVADEERERRRRIVRYSSMAAVLVVIVAGLFWYGIYSTERKRNEGETQYQRGLTYYGIQDYVKAMECFEKAIANGNTTAQNNIGNMYYHGRGVKQDYAKAMEWYEKAAANGNAMAQNNIGNMYYHGRGVKQNYAKAMEWYGKAAANGNTIAQYEVGRMYYDGFGVKQDYTKAMEWYEKAAINGDSLAQISIGLMYYNGQGVKKDYVKAADWYEKAAANGNTVAQYEIGHMYDLGLGVERNYAKAIGWYEKSASNGNTDARYAILRMYNESLKNFIVASHNKEGQVPGEWVSNLVQNPFDELKRIRFGQNENVGGVEVRWIQNNSLLKRLGIQRGDIIRAVNGIPSLTIQDIINIINSLESSERLDFELTSGGENITLRYVIKK